MNDPKSRYVKPFRSTQAHNRNSRRFRLLHNDKRLQEAVAAERRFRQTNSNVELAKQWLGTTEPQDGQTPPSGDAGA